MNVKTICIGLLLLVASSIGLIAQGGNDETPQRDNSSGEMHERDNQRGRGQQGRNTNRNQGTAGEITSIDVNAKTFDIEVKNNATITVSIDDDTKLVYADDAQDLLDNTESRGRQRDLRDSIDTEGMTDEEIRQAMFDANEERIAEMGKAIEAIAIDFSDLAEGNTVRVQLSPSGDNVARLIIVD